ncbi:hypothetical protein G6F42_002058 [Rhizopus arrhizus]|nr:hypothetical protein G6F42_002058 [Rhizopus arrhizus]
MNEEYNFDSETVSVMIQSYMDWEETAAVNAAQKEAKRKTKPHSKEPSLDVVKKERGSYITKNEAKVVNLINLLQEFENMSISEAGRKVGLSKSTAIRKVKQWNQMTSEIAEKGFPDSIAIKEGKGRLTILKDEHTVFIFKLLANEPTLTVEAVTDHLSKEFRDIQITPRSVENHMKKKCRLTYKRIIPRYYGRNKDETVAKRRDAVAYWGANVSILGAICKSGLITLSRKEVVLSARSGKRTRTGEKSQAPKRKGTTSSDFLEYIEQVLTALNAANMSYKYLVLDNASIHKAALIEDWVN